MNRRSHLLLVFVATLSSTTLVLGSQAQAEPAGAAAPAQLADPVTRTVDLPVGPSRVIVTLATDVEPESELTGWKEIVDRRATITADQNRLSRTLSGSGSSITTRFTTVSAVAATVTPDGLAALENDPNVLAIEPDIAVAVELNTSTTIVQADAMWSAGHTGAGSAIVIVDTGVQSSHTMFAASPSGDRVVAEACYSTTDALWGETSLCPDGTEASTIDGSGVDCPLDVDGCGHGTHVAGIAAGGPYTIGATTISGVAPDADMIAINVFTKFDVRTVPDRSGVDFYPCVDPASDTCYDPCDGVYPCALSYTSDQIAALDRVAELAGSHDIVAVNMSLGGGAYSTHCDNSAIGLTIRDLKRAGITTVVASGNSGFTGYVSSPGCVSHAVTVGATGGDTSTKDRVATYTNTAGDLVDLYAPGTGITSAVPTSTYATYSGTSMAAPHVAGAFALMADALPTATPEQILSVLQSTGTPVSTRSSSTPLGFTIPRINIADAAGTPVPPLLTIAFTGDGMATITSNPMGIDCGGTCSLLVATPTSYTLTATLTEGNVINGWTGCDSATATTCTVSVGASNATVTVDVDAVPAANDAVAAATAITLDGSGSYTNSTYTTNATLETEEPTPTCASSIGPSIWYRWTAPTPTAAETDVEISLVGSNYDTVVAVWTGSALADLAQVACNDDIDPGVTLQSEVTFTAQPGVVHLIQISGWQGDFGHVEFAMQTVAVPTADLEIVILGDGSGAVTSAVTTEGDTITCGPTVTVCTTALRLDTSVALTATPSADSAFVAWSSSCAARVTQTTCDTTVRGDLVVAVWFRSTSAATPPVASVVSTLPTLESLASDTSPVPGETVTIGAPAGTFDPHERVVVSLFSDPVVLADLDAAVDGSLSTIVTIPVDTPAGAHTLAALGLVSGAGVRVGVTVIGDEAKPMPVFTSLTPVRVLDTRSGVGGPAARVGALDGSGAPLEVQIAGRAGVPVDGVSAVALNVTVVDGRANDFGGFVTVFPCGTRPDASNLNFISGQTVPNAVVAPLSADGAVCLYVYGTAHLLVDVSGFFTSGFSPVTPARLLDTRSSGERAGALDGSGTAVEVQVTGRAGVPAEGVSAVALNVTVVDGAANDFGGFVTVFPCGTRPDASNLNFISGQTVPNAVIAPLSADGRVCLYVYGTAHLLTDVSGFFTSGFASVTPSRLLDSRSSGSRVGALDGSGTAVEVQVTGRAGVPADGVSAVALNVTVVDGAANDFGGFVTVFPCGTRPDASNLNFISGQTVPNAVIAPLSADGRVCLYVYGTAHLLVDISGHL